MKGCTKLIGEKGNIHMENIPDQEEVEYPIKEDLWNTESNIVRNTVKNNLHKNGWMMNDAGVAEQLDYEIQDVYFTDKNKIAPNYERKPKEGDEVVVDNDQVRITYINSYIIDELDKNAFSNNPYFYVENRTDHDLKIEVEGTAILDGKIIRAQTPFDVTFKVYDYTESYGEYINDNVYGVSHNNSIKEILDPTMKQYDAQIVMRDIND